MRRRPSPHLPHLLRRHPSPHLPSPLDPASAPALLAAVLLQALLPASDAKGLVRIALKKRPIDQNSRVTTRLTGDEPLLRGNSLSLGSGDEGDIVGLKKRPIDRNSRVATRLAGDDPLLRGNSLSLGSGSSNLWVPSAKCYFSVRAPLLFLCVGFGCL
ncbi:hypothetical protein ACQ4PT_018750 [Festuca glaucescens]